VRVRALFAGDALDSLLRLQLAILAQPRVIPGRPLDDLALDRLATRIPPSANRSSRSNCRSSA
jgi:hypothetical protein